MSESGFRAGHRDNYENPFNQEKVYKSEVRRDPPKRERYYGGDDDEQAQSEAKSNPKMKPKSNSNQSFVKSTISKKSR